MKKLLICAAFVAAISSATPLAWAANDYSRRPPPPPRHESQPEPRRGHVWVPGHWDRRDNRYVWVGGRWLRERPGYWYSVPVWEERDGRWVRQRGGWARRDRDRDGIPNRADRDRDGDGVRNRDDMRPDNPRRY